MGRRSDDDGIAGIETFTVLECGRHRPIASGLTLESAVALADKLWKPGTVFFIVGTEGSSVTVGTDTRPAAVIEAMRRGGVAP